LRAADYAWLALGVGIVVYELAAPDGELLSAGWDRYLTHSPVLARVLPLVLCLHVVNLLPRRVDPVAGLFVLVRLIKGIF